MKVLMRTFQVLSLLFFTAGLLATPAVFGQDVGTTDIPPELTGIAQELGCTSAGECRIVCEADFEQCIELSNKYNLYTPAEAELAQTYQNEVLDNLTDFSDESAVIDLARNILADNPDLTDQLELNEEVIDQAETVIGVAEAAGVNFEFCRTLDFATAPRADLARCAELWQDTNVQQYIPDEDIEIIDEVGITIDLREALTRGEYTCGDNTLDGCGEFCLNPDSDVTAPPQVCEEIALRFFGVDGVRDLEDAYTRVGEVRDFYETQNDHIFFTTLEGETLIDLGLIGGYLEDEAATGNVEAIDSGTEYLLVNGFIEPEDREFALEFVRHIDEQGIPEIDFDACSQNIAACQDFIPPTYADDFDIFNQIEDILLREMEAEGITDPERCEIDSAAGEACIRAARQAIPLIEVLGDHPQIQEVLDEIERHIEFGEKGLEARDRFREEFSDGDFSIGGRVFATEIQAIEYCNTNSTVCLETAAREGYIDEEHATDLYENFIDQSFTFDYFGPSDDFSSFPGEPYPAQFSGFTSDQKEDILDKFKNWLDNPQGVAPIIQVDVYQQSSGYYSPGPYSPGPYPGPYSGSGPTGPNFLSPQMEKCLESNGVPPGDIDEMRQGNPVSDSTSQQIAKKCFGQTISGPVCPAYYPTQCGPGEYQGPDVLDINGCYAPGGCIPFGTTPPVTCNAWFEGWVLDPYFNQCVEQGIGGCNDPFEFKTKLACEDANNITDPPGGYCGDTYCQGFENQTSCPSDCGAAPFCGDNFCNGSETNFSCPSDCGGSIPSTEPIPQEVLNALPGAYEVQFNPPTQIFLGSGGGGNYVIWDVDQNTIVGQGSCWATDPPPSWCYSTPPIGPFCGNFQCELGESTSSCPIDCSGALSYCGDNFCDADEDATSCSIDCATGGVCPATKYNSLTNSSSCDLGACPNGCNYDQGCPVNCITDDGTVPAICGDNVCDPGEYAYNCANDCGGCNSYSTENACNGAGCEWYVSTGSGTALCQSPSPAFSCDFNGICGDYENTGSCPSDCGGGSYCGNAICDSGETISSCPGDCGGGGYCGDGVCNGTETATSCSFDCGGVITDCKSYTDQSSCTAIGCDWESSCISAGSCGNAICETGETSSCPGDCGLGSSCGNYVCDASETVSSCPVDCTGAGSCNYNGTCDSDESSASCSDCYYSTPGSNCPPGFHSHSDNGGYCINDADDYSGTCYNLDGSAIITCPGTDPGLSSCNAYTDQTTCTSYTNCHWYSDSTGDYCYYDDGSASYCGNNYCDFDESSATCPTDCDSSTGSSPDSSNVGTKTFAGSSTSCPCWDNFCPSTTIFSTGTFCFGWFGSQQFCVAQTGSHFTPENYTTSACPTGGLCNYNSTCDPGEDSTCSDCSIIDDYCGNSICDAGETSTSCPGDCETTGACTDDSCCQATPCTNCETGFYKVYDSAYGACDECATSSDCKSGYTCNFAGLCSTTSTSDSCGDGTCGSGETTSSCPSDCGSYVPPPPGSSGSCPSGFHYHSESGGYCINDAEDVSGTCYNSDGSVIITCPTSGGYDSSCNSYTDESTCTSYTNCHWYSDSTGDYCYYDSGGGGGGGSYCGDYYCDSGETSSSCPSDCSSGSTGGSCYSIASESTCVSSGCTWYINHYDGTHCDDAAHGAGSSYCGDYFCDSDEDSSSCPTDCSSSGGGGGWCGDDSCNGSETASSCPFDCGGSITDCQSYADETSCTAIGCTWESSCISSGSCGNSTCEVGETTSCPGDCGLGKTISSAVHTIPLNIADITNSFKKLLFIFQPLAGF